MTKRRKPLAIAAAVAALLTTTATAAPAAAAPDTTAAGYLVRFSATVNGDCLDYHPTKQDVYSKACNSKADEKGWQVWRIKDTGIGGLYYIENYYMADVLNDRKPCLRAKADGANGVVLDTCWGQVAGTQWRIEGGKIFTGNPRTYLYEVAGSLDVRISTSPPAGREKWQQSSWSF
ncbi:hypothetical protein OIE66_19715 [Nonomuraea sp. NBC_01738]|uniref:hypothetical protein n=1 Tax=Nonomuraea sp. NBC_01738 TaxID=2976003 RepID=UPI002E0F1260|nr:hypothetical protein OIE66_19715 [Nonomuraea sp. NBC_01738]